MIRLELMGELMELKELKELKTIVFTIAEEVSICKTFVFNSLNYFNSFNSQSSVIIETLIF